MILILRKAGQLGNQLSSFSYCIANAIERKDRVINVPFFEYGRDFEGTRSDSICRYPPSRSSFNGKSLNRAVGFLGRALQRLEKVSPGFVGTLNEGSLNTVQNRSTLERSTISVTPSWWISDEENLRKHSGAIREFFTPVKRIRDELDIKEAEIRRSCDLLVGIHIRRGDYKTVVPAYYFDYSVYRKFMRSVADLYPDRKVTFFICSDEPVPTSEFSEFDVHSFSQSAVMDMYLLARCDRIIGTKSSFNSWASFYGKVPAQWIVRADREFDESEFMVMLPGFTPQHWRTSLCGKVHPYFSRQGNRSAKTA